MKKIRIRDTVFYYIVNGMALIFIIWNLNLIPVESNNILILFWSIIILIIDLYLFENIQDVYRASRMSVFIQWAVRAFIYSIIIYSVFNDIQVIDTWLKLFFGLVVVKMLFLSWTARRLKSNKITYNTVLIGHGLKARSIAERFSSHSMEMGQNLIGTIGEQPIPPFTYLGNISQLSLIMASNQIEECILALENHEGNTVSQILNELRSYTTPALIRITPDAYDILMGHLKLNALYSEPLIELPSGKMPLWQSIIKRLFDLISSCLLMVLLSPFIIYIIIKIKASSKGSILYSQTRVGKNGKPFIIYKFRSMIEQAEPDGPQLSFDGDTRVTKWGKVMRKWRLDEIPQFYNVLKGDMSIVGPRPEREFFIEKIKEKAPFYSRILSVRPGITSWGQVKYGYANSVNQMIERLKFDLIYVENQSLALDIKIILYTILVLFQGKGT